MNLQSQKMRELAPELEMPGGQEIADTKKAY